MQGEDRDLCKIGGVIFFFDRGKTLLAKCECGLVSIRGGTLNTLELSSGLEEMLNVRFKNFGNRFNCTPKNNI